MRRLAIIETVDALGCGLFWDSTMPLESWASDYVWVTQEQAGAVLLKQWQFPDETVQAIEWQREPAKAPQPNWAAEALEFAAAALPALLLSKIQLVVSSPSRQCRAEMVIRV